MRELSPARVTVLEALTKKPFETFPHVELKHVAAHTRLAVHARPSGRVSDATPYANSLLVCG